jgi:hypothetical protein
MCVCVCVCVCVCARARVCTYIPNVIANDPLIQFSGTRVESHGWQKSIIRASAPANPIER